MKERAVILGLLWLAQGASCARHYYVAPTPGLWFRGRAPTPASDGESKRHKKVRKVKRRRRKETLDKKEPEAANERPSDEPSKEATISEPVDSALPEETSRRKRKRRVKVRRHRSERVPTEADETLDATPQENTDEGKVAETRETADGTPEEKGKDDVEPVKSTTHRRKRRRRVKVHRTRAVSMGSPAQPTTVVSPSLADSTVGEAESESQAGAESCSLLQDTAQQSADSFTNKTEKGESKVISESVCEEQENEVIDSKTESPAEEEEEEATDEDEEVKATVEQDQPVLNENEGQDFVNGESDVDAVEAADDVTCDVMPEQVADASDETMLEEDASESGPKEEQPQAQHDLSTPKIETPHETFEREVARVEDDYIPNVAEFDSTATEEETVEGEVLAQLSSEATAAKVDEKVDQEDMDETPDSTVEDSFSGAGQGKDTAHEGSDSIAGSGTSHEQNEPRGAIKASSSVSMAKDEDERSGETSRETEDESTGDESSENEQDETKDQSSPDATKDESTDDESSDVEDESSDKESSDEESDEDSSEQQEPTEPIVDGVSQVLDGTEADAATEEASALQEEEPLDTSVADETLADEGQSCPVSTNATNAIKEDTPPTSDVSTRVVVKFDDVEDTEDDDTDLTVSVVTWNLAESSPSEEEASFIRNFRDSPEVGVKGSKGFRAGSDIVLISGQECENTKPRRAEGHRSREFRRLMIKMLGRKYVPIAIHSLGGVQFGLFCKRKILGDVESVTVADVACGIGNVFHNKGAIAAFVQMRARERTKKANSESDSPATTARAKSLRMLFVTAHMAAHVKNIDARNMDYWRIASELEAQAPPRFLPPKPVNEANEEGENAEGSGSYLMDSMDRIFFCGDLNYRVDLPRELAEHTINKLASLRQAEDDYADDVSNEKDRFRERLLKHDQLLQTIADGHAFPGFSEAKITFPPTFKFDKDTKEYDTSHKQRIPAWTDRVLFKPFGVRALEYASVEDATHSDHRPVYASFRVNMEGREIPAKKEGRRRRKPTKKE